MRTIDCGTATAGLSAWLDGELAGGDAAALTAHLATCAACDRRRRLLAAVGEAVRALPEERVSGGFDAALRRRAARRFSSARPVALVAAGLAAALAAAWWVTPRGPSGPEPPAAVRTTSIAVRTAGALAADCGLGPSTGRCRVETPCASAAECGRTPSLLWSPTALHAPGVAAGGPGAGVR